MSESQELNCKPPENVIGKYYNEQNVKLVLSELQNRDGLAHTLSANILRNWSSEKTKWLIAMLDDGRGKQVDKVLEECSEILHAMLVRHQDGAVNLDYRMFHRCLDAMTECHRLLYVDNAQEHLTGDKAGAGGSDGCEEDSE